jgi:hypothetical protein
VKLDLTGDRASLAALIADGVAKFARSRAAKACPPITRVDVKYDLTSSRHPWLWVDLDTEPAGQPDSGHSQTFRVAEKVFKHWAMPCHAADKQPVTVVVPGRTVVVDDEETLYEAVGLFLVDVVTGLRDGGAFDALPRAAACYLGVSAYDGTYGWPEYEDRGPANMLRPPPGPAGV